MLTKGNKGFTLTEFLFGLALFALAFGLFIPNAGCTMFLKPPYKEREAEVKACIHTIQIALERFAVDTGGKYPFILYGGDETDTFATSKSPPPPYNPDYKPWPNDVDVLLEKNYLVSYPENPFTREVESGGIVRIITNPAEYGLRSLEIEPGRVNIWATPQDRGREYIRRKVGGENCNSMWDVSEGHRHPPWPMVIVPDPPPSPTGFVNPIEPPEAKKYDGTHQFWLTPGNFYYYALFDGVGCYSSFVDKNGDGIGEVEYPVQGEVIGFKLAGYGHLLNPGADVYNLYGDWQERSLFTINQPDDPNLNVGPDGRPDGVIIVVQSGTDKGIREVMEEVGNK